MTLVQRRVDVVVLSGSLHVNLWEIEFVACNLLFCMVWHVSLKSHINPKNYMKNPISNLASQHDCYLYRQMHPTTMLMCGHPSIPGVV